MVLFIQNAGNIYYSLHSAYGTGLVGPIGTLVAYVASCASHESLPLSTIADCCLGAFMSCAWLCGLCLHVAAAIPPAASTAAHDAIFALVSSMQAGIFCQRLVQPPHTPSNRLVKGEAWLAFRTTFRGIAIQIPLSSQLTCSRMKREEAAETAFRTCETWSFCWSIHPHTTTENV